MPSFADDAFRCSRFATGIVFLLILSVSTTGARRRTSHPAPVSFRSLLLLVRFRDRLIAARFNSDPHLCSFHRCDRRAHATIDICSRQSRTSCCFGVIFLKDNKRSRYPTLRSKLRLRQRDFLRAGRSSIVRIGRGRLPLHRHRRGAGSRRPWIRPRSLVRTGRMVVRPCLGSRTRTAIR